MALPFWNLLKLNLLSELFDGDGNEDGRWKRERVEREREYFRVRREQRVFFRLYV